MTGLKFRFFLGAWPTGGTALTSPTRLPAIETSSADTTAESKEAEDQEKKMVCVEVYLTNLDV